MLSIRKFVGCFKVVVVVTSLLVLGLTSQAASARTVATSEEGVAPPANETHASTLALSPACTAAVQNIKAAFADDRAEDAAERAQAALEPETAADQAEDIAELASLKALFTAAHTACAAAITAAIKSHTTTTTRTPQCAAAVQALKAELKTIWTQGTRPTSAQWAQVRTLGAAARAACGWSNWTWRER